MKRRLRKISAMLLMALLLTLLLLPGTALADSISDMEDQIAEEERKKQEAEQLAAYLESLYSGAQNDLAAANAELEALIDEMVELDRQTTDAEEELANYVQLKEQTEADIEEQKNSMVRRIQYMYEQQSGSVWTILAEADSLGDVMNSADYITSIAEYDHRMLQEYKASLEKVDTCVEEAEARRESLTQLSTEADAKKQSFVEKTEAAAGRMNEYKQQMNAAGEAAAEYAASIAENASQLNQMKEAAEKAAAEAEARRLEAERIRQAEEEERRLRAEEEERIRKAAEEEKRRLEEEAEARRKAAEEERARQAAEEEQRRAAEGLPTPSDRRGVGSINIDPNAKTPLGCTNLELLAAIIDCEAGGQPYEGKVAVGNVIYNRILSPQFQMTIYDVIYGPGQFTPVTNGTLDIMLAKGARESCVQAARDCLNGVRTIPEEYLFFCSLNSWYSKPKKYIEYFQLGSHMFYYN